MPTLDQILEEARLSPDNAARCPLLDSGLHAIRAPTSAVFRDRVEQARRGKRDLHQVRVQNAEEGLEVIEPMRAGIRGGYWYLRNQSDQGESFPAGRAHFFSLAEALGFALVWWQAAPWNRGVVVRAAYFDLAKHMEPQYAGSAGK